MIGCAGVGPVATPSGNPEVTIKSTNATRIKSAIVQTFSQMGFQLVGDGQFSLAFVKPMDVGQATLYTVLMGNSYSSMPNLHVTVSVAPGESTTRVYGHIGVDMQGVFGQNQGTTLDHGKAGHELQVALEQVKSSIES
jgi:hypothetical protein